MLDRTSRSYRLRVLAALSLVLTLATAVQTAPPAAATPGFEPGYCRRSDYDCVGGGYAATAASTGDSWAWRLYGTPGAGDLGSPPHNCTLYAAWRLQQVGVGNPGWAGHAYQWGGHYGHDRRPAVGAIAWWDRRSTSDFGHVAYVEQVSADGSRVYVKADNYLGGSRGYTDSGWISAASVSGFIHIRDTAAPPVDRDGDFVSYAGKVYRMAGGAPIYVSSWDPFGGPQPTRALSDQEWASLRVTPRDGTTLAGRTSGRVYVVAGGAPQYVSSFEAIGGPRSSIQVDDAAIDRAGEGDPWQHLGRYPTNGTYVNGGGSGRVYVIAGGAPTFVSSWENVGGQKPTVTIDDATIAHAGDTDSTWGHLRSHPSDGFIRGFRSGRIFRVVYEGHRYYVPSWTPYGGPQPYVDVDDNAIDGCDHLACGPFGSLDQAVGGAEKISTVGWGMDPDSTDSIAVHLYVDDTYAGATRTGVVRQDVDDVFHRGTTFGFSTSLSAKPGQHTVCAYGINAGAGGNDRLGSCKTVTVTAKPLVKNLRAPSISGTVRVGKVVKAKVGTWSPSGLTYQYRWKVNGQAIKGATRSTYKIPASARKKRLSVVVKASRSGYRAHSTESVRSAKVRS
ncbi:hypothetical protein ASD11_09540 [Aeromicrobium sp. Root495]|uniref:CHAP domain-containing protein n=1 Tax=Aeromicrobium sp. Root495 TaxID=1736550 RepID=UPI0006FD13A7|nr:CHAP domain-containing protein [Aeromicrobium sp. Root495]KQY59770.1 hypothetical protein ASD11_09540 [Aeromicrobium sp. Root495]